MQKFGSLKYKIVKRPCMLQQNTQKKISTYISVEPIVIQSLKEHGDTEEDGMQKEEDSGGGVFP